MMAGWYMLARTAGRTFLMVTTIIQVFIQESLAANAKLEMDAGEE
jgi:hypothetical protein